MDNKRGEFLKNLNIQAILSHEEGASISNDLPLRKWLYAWILDPHQPGNYQKEFDKWFGFLIIANMFALIFEHIPAIYAPYQHWFEFFDVFSVAAFTIEYALRLYLAPEDEEFKQRGSPRFGFITSPFAIIDILAIAPFYLKSFIPIDLRVLRILRLLRILKLFRVLIPAIEEFKELNKGRTFRQKVHALVFPGMHSGKLHDIFEAFIGLWIVLSFFAVVMETVKSVHYIMNIQFVILDAVAVGVFTIEFCMRIYSCVEEPKFKGAIIGRLKQAKTPSTLIDFLAIVPFFLEVILHHLFDLRFLRVFRLTRLLKLTRGSDATAILFKVITREWPILSAAAFIMILVIVMTASLSYLFEYDAQPEKFENIPTAIYWAVITLASVGYGDISPVTPIGRAVTTLMALMGIGIFALPAALLASAFSDELIKERESLKANLFNILKKGVITDDEAHFIRSEAKRLHLSNEEINALVDVVIKENELEERNPLPIHKIAEHPGLAAEHYRFLIGQIRQLGIHADMTKVEESVNRNELLSPAEFSLWQQIQGKAQ